MQLLVFCATLQLTTPQFSTLPLAARGGDRNLEGEGFVGRLRASILNIGSTVNA
jgi:hypothetical protein